MTILYTQLVTVLVCDDQVAGGLLSIFWQTLILDSAPSRESKLPATWTVLKNAFQEAPEVLDKRKAAWNKEEMNRFPGKRSFRLVCSKIR